MTDFLIRLGKNPQARRIISSLGIPLPLPEQLKRDSGPWQERPLAESHIVFNSVDGGEVGQLVAEALLRAGAALYEVGEAKAHEHALPLDALGEDAKADAVVMDATGITNIGELRQVYDFFQPLARRLSRSARVIILGRPADEMESAEAAAAQRALEGFVRSVAKEIGKTGSTANLIAISEGAEDRLEGALRFIASPRSAFITAQPLVVDLRTQAVDGDAPFVRPLDKKLALVTGAARGIGAQTAKLLAQEGAHVICLDRPEDQATTDELAGAISGTSLLADLSDTDAPQKIADKIKELGGVDIIVHNAGITRDRTMFRMSEEEWHQVIDVNLAAVNRLTQALEPMLKEGGRIVCLSSVVGVSGNAGQANYSASKAGVIGWVTKKAKELAGRGITVNAVAPGFIETRLTAAIPIGLREMGRRTSALVQGGQPEDVAQAIVFLASPGAQGVTGQTLRVCGGALLGA